MSKKYIVRLSDRERRGLEQLSAKGKTVAYRIRHAHILLKADADGPNWTDWRIAEAFSCHARTVEGIRKRFVEQGLDAALNRKKREMPPREKLLDGEKEARLIALSCSKPPKGRARWTLHLLADKMVELEVVESISHETVRQTLKKNELKPHLRKSWVIPPKQNADFVAHMEDVLEVYKRPYDPDYPVVCMDEQPTQLIKETRRKIEAAPGWAERVDYEYERNGTANNFMFNEPLGNWRKVNVRERKTMIDWAHEIKELLDVDYPEAEKVVLVMDNLNTHKPASLYEAFEPREARRLLERLEIHHTPRHGSWLNIAEIELSVFTRQCLNRRIPHIETLRKEAREWYRERNQSQKGVDWRFTTKNARIKLKQLYPQIES
ncbi:MAG: IS630 family transposase [candidate division Zixibacteria bacterium]|nr:IS630 family transposase [candidate division Zixibacteria bacterium]MBU1470718.1 IS630 family transposase [candidate division Zixibacteria bacterium]